MAQEEEGYRRIVPFQCSIQTPGQCPGVFFMHFSLVQMRARHVRVRRGFERAAKQIDETLRIGFVRKAIDDKCLTIVMRGACSWCGI